jgi:hypothetical protein
VPDLEKIKKNKKLFIDMVKKYDKKDYSMEMLNNQFIPVAKYLEKRK